MKFDMEALLVLVIVAAALGLGYVRQQRARRAGRREMPDVDGAAKRGERPPSTGSSPEPQTAARPVASKKSRRGSGPRTRKQHSADGAGPFSGISNWGYQLQKVKVAEVAASPFQLMVIDYSADGSSKHAFSPSEVARMQAMPGGGRRLVLSYLSVGEAESYRYYWDPAWKGEPPSWLIGENPEWPENYAVRFWDPSWQRLMFGRAVSYLDRIIAAGFDGVYLDKCDVFEDLQQNHPTVAAERTDMEADMVAFVVRLSRYAKGRMPGFAIVMQNAEVLLEDEALRMAIDGVAKEELLYGYAGPEKPNPKDEVAFSKNALDLARSAGKPVFVVEYLGNRDKIGTALATLGDYGYIGTVAGRDRDLDKLNPDPAMFV